MVVATARYITQILSLYWFTSSIVSNRIVIVVIVVIRVVVEVVVVVVMVVVVIAVIGFILSCYYMQDGKAHVYIEMSN